MTEADLPRLKCERCGRLRSADRMVPAHCVHGSFYVCASKEACKQLAKHGRRAAKAIPVRRATSDAELEPA